MISYGRAFREAIKPGQILPLIGIYDTFSASVAARHYDALFLSGFGFAASYYGLPDIGFIAWPDILALVERVRTVLPRHHLLVDIDDGYGDPEVAVHVVSRLAAIGASGFIMEDQKRPRKCGHFDGKEVLPLDEYLAKLERVKAVKRDLVLVARTDASERDEILRRARAFSQAGADVVLVDGVRSIETIREVRAVITRPLLFNQIAGGKSPRLSLSELRAAGVQLAIYSTPCLFAVQNALEETMRQLRHDDGRLPSRDDVPVGVAECTALLAANLGRRDAAPTVKAGHVELEAAPVGLAEV
jgi:2-methylisocitrate lyase-like PEP mutase family enzyme